MFLAAWEGININQSTTKKILEFSGLCLKHDLMVCIHKIKGHLIVITNILRLNASFDKSFLPVERPIHLEVTGWDQPFTIFMPHRFISHETQMIKLHAEKGSILILANLTSMSLGRP